MCCSFIAWPHAIAWQMICVSVCWCVSENVSSSPASVHNRMNTPSTGPINNFLWKRKDGGVHRKDRDVVFYGLHECSWVCICPSVWFVLTQAVRAVYGEAHEDDVSVWIGERSQPVIVLLTRCVPESQLHLTRTQTDIESKEGRESREKRGMRKKWMKKGRERS